MSGLQSLLHSAGRTVRSTSSCPRGTPGRLITRRLSLSTRLSQTQLSYSDRLDPPSIPEIDEFTPRGEPTTSWLDPKITGLTPTFPENRGPALRRMYQHLSMDDNESAWEAFMHIQKAGQNSLLRPSDYNAILRHFRPRTYAQARPRHRIDSAGNIIYETQEELIERFYGRITYIIHYMKKKNIPLGLDAVFTILETARAGENDNMATKLWDSIANSSKHYFLRRSPDTWCWNSYMASMCGTGRIDRWIRSSETKVEERKRYNKDPFQLATKILKSMQDSKTPPNAMTIELYVLAAGRMRQLTVIKTALKSVWSIDLDAIMSDHTPPTPESARDPATSPKPDNPIYPTPMTILNIVVALATMGHITEAIRVMEHIHLRFSVAIPMQAWVALLSHTYGWAHTRNDTRTVDPGAVLKVFETMISESYNVSPTIDMYDYPIRSLLHRGMPDAAESLMESSLSEIRRLLSVRDEAEEELIALRAITAREKKRMRILESVLSEASRDLETARAVVRRWTELLVLGKSMQGMERFAQEKVPKWIEKWSYFLGESVVYYHKGGYVEVGLGEERRWDPVFRRVSRSTRFMGDGSRESDDFL